jgi:hypothetical protein
VDIGLSAAPGPERLAGAVRPGALVPEFTPGRHRRPHSGCGLTVLLKAAFGLTLVAAYNQNLNQATHRYVLLAPKACALDARQLRRG